MTASSVQTEIGVEEAAARDVVERVNAAWGANDPDAFADAFAPDATLILSGDRYFNGRENIRRALHQSFATDHKGTRLSTYVVDFRWLDGNIASMVTEGGVLLPGQSEPDWERALRATWIAARQPDGTYLVASYQNGRRADGALRGHEAH